MMDIRKWIAISFLFLGSVALYGQSGHYATDKIRDLALIYQGGSHRLDWTEDQFKPFVAHRFQSGKKDWLFDGFLFLEYTTGKGRTYAMGFVESSARKVEWDLLLDRLFEKEKSLHALDKSIENLKKELGKPKFKHQVVIGLPMPHEDQKDWGNFEGEKMDFSLKSHQLKVLKWYIEQVSSRFKAQKFKNIDLKGYYWVEEDTIYSKSITKDLKPIIKQEGKEFYWIPYWKARGHHLWKEMGFDIAYLQPNHFFKHDIPDERLDEAALLAKELNMGMEIEFDKTALYEAKDSKYNRFKAYLDYFERHGVFAQSAIAYYSGSDGLLRFSESAHAKDREIMDRLAKLIVERRKLLKIKK